MVSFQSNHLSWLGTYKYITNNKHFDYLSINKITFDRECNVQCMIEILISNIRVNTLTVKECSIPFSISMFLKTFFFSSATMLLQNKMDVFLQFIWGLLHVTVFKRLVIIWSYKLNLPIIPIWLIISCHA